MSAISEKELSEIIEDNGYRDPKTFEDGSVACLMPLMFTCAIIHDINRTGYADRWCYHSISEARTALEAWDGADGTEPEGWHRHPVTGRRRDDDGNEWVAR